MGGGGGRLANPWCTGHRLLWAEGGRLANPRYCLLTFRANLQYRIVNAALFHRVDAPLRATCTDAPPHESVQHQIVDAGPDLRGFFPSTAGCAGRTFRECSLLGDVIKHMALADPAGLQYRTVSAAPSHRVDRRRSDMQHQIAFVALATHAGSLRRIIWFALPQEFRATARLLSSSMASTSHHTPPPAVHLDLDDGAYEGAARCLSLAGGHGAPRAQSSSIRRRCRCMRG